LRGVAALVVAFYHCDAMTGLKPAGGYLAVDLFFVLSGFVLAYAYDARFEEGLSATEFMRVRVIRLYPLYLLGLLAVTLAILADYFTASHISWTPESLAKSFALSLGFQPTPPGVAPRDALYPLNTPAWSLAFELVVNLWFALTWSYLSKRALAAIASVAALLVLATSQIYGSLDAGSTWDTALGGFARVFFSFPVGVLLLRLYRDHGVRIRLGSTLPMLIVLTLLFLHPSAPLRPIYDAVCVVICFPLLVLAGADAQPHRFTTLCTFLGAISYALYALHFPIFEMAFAAFTVATHGHVETVQPWGGLACIAIALGAAYLADAFYDRPVRKWLSTKFRGARDRRSSVATRAGDT
jgi:peptidoglycan/LPS O-acetylase OafA/YrhL